MPAQSPAEISRLFTKALHSSDVDSLVALYWPEASLVPQPGQIATGTEAIRQAMIGYVAMKPTMNVQVQQVFQVDNIALVHANWTMTGTAPDGSLINMGGKSADVMRRQPDGTWLVLIDNPFGTDYCDADLSVIPSA